jgi:hypothetical protein
MERFEGVKLVDAFRRLYEKMAAEQSMTFEQMKVFQNNSKLFVTFF